MEVIVSAAVLLLVVLGVLAAMDSVAKTAGVNKARSVAATLAEKDQERLRGMHMDDVGGALPAYDVTVAGVKYHVEPKAVWVTDASDEEVGCGAQNSQGSYVRLTSTVTSPMTGAAIKPVVLSSIMAPRSKGALVALVKNAADQPVQGLTVTAPPLTPKTTNAAGCAVFSQIEAGNYTVGLNQTGWVDWNGNQTPTKLAGVTSGNVTTVEFAYDRAARITVTVQNKPTAQGGLLEPAATVLGANPKPTTGMRKSTPPFTIPAPVPSVAYPTGTGSIHSVTDLFPFPEGYTFYSGACLGADPSKQVGNENYFSSYSGKVTLAPGQAGAVTVYEPNANFTVRTGSGTARTNATVFAYPTSPGCAGAKIPMGLSSLAGKTVYMGLPYGDYDICAQYSSSGTTRRNTVSVRVDTPNGASTPVNIPLSSASTAGACP